MVSVVIAVVFLVTVGIVILSVATRYAVAVFVDHNSTGNFYAAEGILEEVKTGLVEYASTASEKAYIETLESYGATTVADASKAGTEAVSSMQSQFSERYIKELGGKLLNHFYWRVGELQQDDDMLDKLKALTYEPEAVKKVTGVIVNRDAKGLYYLTIKDLLVDYTDEADYRSTIQTDISIRVPDYKFQGDSTLNEIKNYISISDDTLELGAGAAAVCAGSSLTGNIYSGSRTGILVGDSVDLNCNSIITRGNFEVNTGAEVSLQGESGAEGDLWARNILISPKEGSSGSESSHTRLEMTENAYIANDLAISDNYSDVKLKGKYYGYSYNENNDASSSETAGEYSSAILINGLNTDLDGTELDKMILAGRAFVSTESDTGTVQPGKSQIRTGESVAVKSDQLAYLVPDRYIKIDGSTDDGHNPVARGENFAIDKEGLRAEYGSYLAAEPEDPFTANYNNAGNYVFFFLNFASDKKANEFFEAYYGGNYTDEDGNEVSHRDELKERARPYLTSIDTTLGIKLSGNLNLIAGNIVKNYDATGTSGLQKANYYETSGAPLDELLQDGQKTGIMYVNKQLYLTSSGDASQMRMTEEQENDKKLVEHTLIDFSKVPDVISEIGTAGKADPATGGKIYIADGSYVVDSGAVSKGLIIATGDVEVQRDFEGLIIAGGKVSVTRANVKMTANISLISNLLEKVKTDPDWAAIRKIFRGLSGSAEQETTDITSCFKYENWTKNNG